MNKIAPEPHGSEPKGSKFSFSKHLRQNNFYLFQKNTNFEV